MLSRLLASWGHELVVTTDGRAAWDVLQTADAPKVAILDWMMPEMDGVESLPGAMHRLGTEVEEPTYVILLTAKDRTEDLVLGLESGANDYLVKPFDRRELQARLRVAERVVSLQHEVVDRVCELQEALAQIHQLQGLLPICSYCKKIRSDGDYWQQLEGYLSRHTGVQFSHGVCAVLCRNAPRSWNRRGKVVRAETGARLELPSLTHRQGIFSNGRGSDCRSIGRRFIRLRGAGNCDNLDDPPRRDDLRPLSAISISLTLPLPHG